MLTETSNLKHFRIEGLFGNRNVDIPFDGKPKVLIGENGIGKTSILNALYYTLTCNFSKLNTIVFQKISIAFNTGKSVELSKEEISLSEDEERIRSRQEGRLAETIGQLLTKQDRETLLNYFEQGEKSRSELDLIVSKLSRNLGFPNDYIARVLTGMFSGRLVKIEQARRVILSEVNSEVLYFPTYRRIEEELSKLGVVQELKMPNDDKRLIQFGMDDVSNTFRRVIETIKNSSISGFTEITGEMLSQYLEGAPKPDRAVREIIVPEVLKIILERVGENISSSNKDRILALVESEEIFEKTEYAHLLNFLSKLIKIYEQQRDTDNSIKTFESTCNKYLIGKKVIYNESKVTINVIHERSKSTILLKNLSSGEKQILSVFAKLMFSESKQVMVLFDEPELSLSLEWQKKILPDIIGSKTCTMMLAVTHSPFIFDNELDTFAQDINLFVKETTNIPLPDTINKN